MNTKNVSLRGKVASVALSAALVGSMGVFAAVPTTQAHAAGNSSITIDNTVDGQTYKVYKLLDLKIVGSPENPDGYAYTVNSTWKNFLTTGDGSQYVNISKGGNVTIVGDTEAEQAENTAALAKAAIAYAKDNKIAAVAQATDNDSNFDSVTISGLDYGYYLVDSTVGAICVLDTATSNVTVSDKYTAPTVTKTVKDDTSDAGETDTANNVKVGDKVYYTTQITVGKGAVNYVLHDAMDKGLTLDTSSIVVKKGSTKLTASKDYTLRTTSSDDCDFEVEFTKNGHGTNTGLAENDVITVTYSATVNADAVVSTVEGGDKGNENSTYVSYGDNNNIDSNVAETHTYTMALDVYKYSDIPAVNTALEGATFLLKNADGEYYKNTNGIVTWVANASEGTSYTSSDKGKLVFSGIDAGTYYLEETEAPTGYNKLDEDVLVMVTNSPADGNGNLAKYMSQVKLNDSAKPLPVENQTGVILPGTGGAGAAMIYIGGGLILAIGIGATVMRRRKAMANEGAETGSQE